MKTHTFTMAALAAGVALVLSAQVQGQVVFPKVVTATTGVNIAIGTTSGNPGDLVTDGVVLNILTSTILSPPRSVLPTFSIPLTSSTGLIAPGSVKIDSEIITYTAITGNNLTGATRGANMTTAAAHTAGATVNLQVLGTQNDITVNGGAGAVITIPEASSCNLDSKSCGPTTTCADQTCDGGACSIDGAACTTAADCAKQTCAATGAPDCAVNPAILKEATTFGYQPPACCSAGSCPGTCTGIRALVFSMKAAGSKAPILDGKTLYTCKIQIASNAGDMVYPLVNLNQVASDQSGNSILASGSDGSVTVPGVVNTPTGSPTGSPTPTVNGPTSTPSHGTTTPGTPSGTSTRTPIRTGGGGRFNDDDACSIVSPANSNAGWMVLLPAAALLWIRRRSR